MPYIYRQPNFYISKEFQDGLVAAYNGKHNGTTVIDISGNGNHGTANGGVVLSRKNNTHFMKFDGVDDNISVSKTWGNQGNTFSIFTIFKILNQQDGSIVCLPYDNNYNSDSFHGPYIDTINNQIFCGIYSTGNGLQKVVLSNVISNKTLFVCSTYDGSTLNGYLYGNYKGSIANGFDNEVSQFKIGMNYYNSGTAKFNGEIGLVLIYNKVISNKQIQKMYEFFRQWYYD